MLKNDSSYRNLGVNHYNEINRQATLKRSIKRLEGMGFKVTIEAA